MEWTVPREQEMEILEAEYNRKGSSFVVLYGRKRVGKTTLLTQFIRDKNKNIFLNGRTEKSGEVEEDGKPALYFQASLESEIRNRRAFCRAVEQMLGTELGDTPTWDDVLHAIIEHPFARKPVIIIDEFQNIGRSYPDFLPHLRQHYERNLQGHNVMVILCSSVLPLVRSQVLAANSPIRSCYTVAIYMRPLGFDAFSACFSGRTLKERIELYAISGGMPQYMQLLGQEDNLWQAMYKHILSTSGFLFYEPLNLLQQEVLELGSYLAVIHAVAAGNYKLSAISEALDVKATSLSKYIRLLIDMDILVRDVPVTERDTEKSKRGLYQIQDNFYRFWSAFIYPNMGLVETGRESEVMALIQKEVTKHTAAVYAQLCRERMVQLGQEARWPFSLERTGRLWTLDCMVPVAAIDRGENIIFGDCFYSQGPVGVEAVRDMERCSDHIARHRKRSKHSKQSREKTEQAALDEREEDPIERAEHEAGDSAEQTQHAADALEYAGKDSEIDAGDKNGFHSWYVFFSTDGFREDMWRLAQEREDILLIDDSE